MSQANPMFPSKYWCPRCAGTGKVRNDEYPDEDDECHVCQGATPMSGPVPFSSIPIGSWFWAAGMDVVPLLKASTMSALMYGHPTKFVSLVPTNNCAEISEKKAEQCATLAGTPLVASYTLSPDAAVKVGEHVRLVSADEWEEGTYLGGVEVCEVIDDNLDQNKISPQVAIMCAGTKLWIRRDQVKRFDGTWQYIVPVDPEDVAKMKVPCEAGDGSRWDEI